jgi:uncharacterized membrane protein YczE
MALVGAGIALLLASSLGASPVDGLFAGVSGLSSFSVGQVMTALSVLMVAFAFALGTRSGVGTLVCFLGIGITVDASVALLNSVVDTASWGLPAQVASWAAGAVLLGIGAAALNASGLGASAYDQFVRAFTRFRLTLPQARLAVDVVALIAALAIGGAVGIGTLGLAVAVPLILRLLLGRLEHWADGSPRAGA